MDGLAGTGGNAIAFALAGKHVVAIEISERRLAMSQHNAGIYNLADTPVKKR